MRRLGQPQLNEMKLLDPTDTSFIKQAKSAWFCCDTTCRTFNQAENKICSRCGSERCPECQAPRNTSFPFITYTYMYICCQCGDGPNVYNAQPRCTHCDHIACSDCKPVK
ncbi:hypothetical protein IFM61606_00491 [Aspergillus udagawae]|uniref:RanBP2-type domain-containing protein n=1 Tax=Aspergillus udagawae TaxID=91492 RepID=A0ABQ1AUK3_9EURO|nr:hypothetical protein IFM51744_02304 [Aspergillus udagawae]GFF86782.1 hypothetical protein IFM53868_04923 [Aspergillus udagawae]GFG17048.1 hypothetical protein IFM5058_08269 [Aspergillus udagawae]GFG20346.1 hypothetical protein IFM61606_00491 [Aspergillus udagawae]